MKKLLFVSAIFCLMASTVMAQDDMYFTPKKKTAEEKAAEAARKERLEAYRKAHTIGGTFYAGRDCDVDDYNRRGSKIHQDSLQDLSVDSLKEYLLASKKSKNHYDDYSCDEDDYVFSRRMNRFYGYVGPYWSPWRHYYDPWYYDWAYHYDPFYWSMGVYDPWFYNFGGWYDPWYYGWSGWHYPGHYHYGWSHAWYRPTIIIGGGGSHYANNVARGPHTAYGTRNHSGSRNNHGATASSGRVSSVSQGMASRDRSNNRTVQAANRANGGTHSTYSNSRVYNNSTPSYSNNSTFNNSSSSAPARSSGSSSVSSGGGGGARSSGGSGSRGGFGGRR